MHTEVRPPQLVFVTGLQREILQLMAEGLSTQRMAQRLELSPATVEAHRAQLMNRLNIHSASRLLRYAVRAGIVPADR
jgi:DNA-binding NarL/FixJ family response regulator